MRIGWFNDNRLGLVKDEKVYDVSAVLARIPTPKYPFPELGDPLIARIDELRSEIERAAAGAASIPVTEARFRSPVSNPTKIIGTPTNYRDHQAEMQADRSIPKLGTSGKSIEEQGLFLKANSCLVGPTEGVTLRFRDQRNDHEMELGVIIGRKASAIPVEKAMDVVAGYAIALDMVVRGSQDRSFRKSIDTYGVLGPWLVTADEVGDPMNLDFSLAVNGEMRQKSNTNLMVMNIAKQISWASEYYTLYPGDIVMTGTCKGVSKVSPGDVMQCEIQTIGSMDVRVS